MSLSHYLTNFVSHYGVAALFLTITLETLGAPLPGESSILISSGLAARGELSPYGVAIAAFLGAILGDNIAYVIGRKFGRPVIIRYGTRVGVTGKAFDRAEGMMQRHGPLIVIGARFVVLLRQMNGLVAGTTGMRWQVFVPANIVGAALWAGAYTFIGYSLGKSPEIVPDILHHMSLVAMVVVPVLIVAVIAMYLHLRRTHGARE